MHAASSIAAAAGIAMAMLYMLWSFGAEELVARVVRRVTERVSFGRVRLSSTSDSDEMICIGALMACTVVFAAALYRSRWG